MSSPYCGSLLITSHKKPKKPSNSLVGKMQLDSNRESACARTSLSSSTLLKHAILFGPKLTFVMSS